MQIPDSLPECQARLEDWYTDYRRVIADTCAGDEQHCSCVPHLRRRIADLESTLVTLTEHQVAVDQQYVDIRVDRDAWRAEAKRLRGAGGR